MRTHDGIRRIDVEDAQEIRDSTDALHSGCE